MKVEAATDEEIRVAVLAALDGFVTLTGVHVDGALGNWTGSRSVSLGSWGVESQIRDLQDLAVLDPSLLTCWMLLRTFTRAWLDARSVSALLLVEDPAKAAETLATARAAWALLDRPRVDRAVEDFQLDVLGSIERAVGRRTAEGDPEAWVMSAPNLALLRRDALLAVDAGAGLDAGREHYKAKGLELHTFSMGERGRGDERPVLADAVYEFWNVNSLLRALRSPRFPDRAVVVCLIRDPEALHSFFVLAIRDGDRIHVLTDRSAEHQEHPLRKKLGRRPDREMDRRAARWWFPYELLDVAVTSDGKELYAKARTALVPLNAEAAPLRALADLHPATLVWLTLVLDLVRVRFFVEDRHALVVSYTGEMVRAPHALADERSALVRSGAYAPLALPKLDVARDLSPEAMAKNTRRPSTGWNRWMVDRYGPLVPEEVLDVVGDRERATLTDRLRGALPMPGGSDRIVNGHNWGVEHGTSVPNLPHDAIDRGANAVRQEALDPTTFGPAEQLAADRTWLAQHNRMRVVQRLAVEEYARTQGAVLAWYHRRLRGNKAFLLDACARGSLELLDVKYDPGAPSFALGYAQHVVAHGEVLDWGVGPTWYAKATRWERGGKKSSYTYDHPYMPLRGAFFREGETPTGRLGTLDEGAGVFAYVLPQTPDAIAVLCGCTPKELPWQLQRFHSDKLRPYHGNDILDRLDAEDFALDNPWRGLPVAVGAALSRTEANARRKALGLPRMDWGAVQACRAYERTSG